MAMQGQSTSPSRDSFKSSGTMQTKIPVGSGHADTTRAGDTGTGQALGSAVKGFSGSGTLKAKI